MEAFVYMWVDTGVTPTMFYIGRKKGDFFKIDAANTYQTSSKHVAAAMLDHPQGFTKRLLLDCGSVKDMAVSETYHLKAVDAARNPLYYNRSNSDGKFINKIPWNKGLTKQDPRVADYTSKRVNSGFKGSFIGKRHSAETLAKMSQQKIGNKSTRGMKIGTPSAEHRMKLSEALKGKSWGSHSEESKRKIGSIHRGKILSEDTRRKMSESRKQLFQKRKLECLQTARTN